MKCPEVIEWMHRYLDNDLNEENTTQMMEHIAHCPQCADSFRMLKSLAHELEELPLVIPKYSLVDAIMPQLDAIDRARLEKCASKERSPEEMVPMPPVSVPKRRFFTGTTARTMIGAVAAMGILGVAIYNYSPQELTDAQMQEQAIAGVETMPSTEQKSVDNGAANNAGFSMAASDTTQQDDLVSDSAVSPNKEAITPDPKEGNGISVPSETDKSSDSSAGSKSPDPSSTKVADTPKQIKEDTPQPSKDVADKSSAQDKSSSQDKSRKIEPDQGQAADRKMEADTPKDPKISEPREGITIDPPSQEGVMNDDKVFSLAAPESWDSPNGKVSAVLEDNKLVIYQLSVDGAIEKTVIQSIDLVGTWVSGEWSSDSKVFTYQISLDGKVSSYTYPNDTAPVIAP